MKDDDFMNLAISEAYKSSEPLKCGVVIVKDGIVITQAFNSQRKDNNSTAHAEIKAIALAGNHLGNKSLEGCIVYGTCEPCTMCLSAMIFAKINKLVYGITLREVSPTLIEIDIDTFLAKSPYRFEIVKNFMVEECRQLLK
jgi:tRNA(adenine34) deaminase